MMTLGVFFGALLLLCAGMIWSAWNWWPGKRWQFIASMPIAPDTGGLWRGVNFTWYGALSASAFALALVLLLFLGRSAGADGPALLGFLVILSLICIPASRVIVRLVEGHWHGFTVGGAMFLGVLVLPWILTALNAWGWNLPLWPVLSATAIAYALGEGCGRLACISFGCCYGRPLAELPPRLARLLRPLAIEVTCPSRKAVYEGRLHAVPLVPIQGLTVSIFSLIGVTGAALHVTGHFQSAVLLVAVGCQGWRFLSEFLRADDRGTPSKRQISAYQIMALAGIIYLAAMTFILPAAPGQVFDFPAASRLLWSPETLLLIQGLWWVLFLRMGRSTVTGSRIQFHNAL